MTVTMGYSANVFVGGRHEEKDFSRPTGKSGDEVTNTWEVHGKILVVSYYQRER
jgi:hypothetical protein